MKILNKFTIQNLKLNKKRTIVTIIGIMLSSALICGVVGLVSSFQKTFVNVAKEMEGNYHTTFYNVLKDNYKYITNNNNVDSYFCTGEVGWATLNESKNDNKPYVHILEYDKSALSNYGISLEEGRLPQNSNEIVISEHIKSNGRVRFSVGDKLTFEVGERISLDGIKLDQKMELLSSKEGTIEESIENKTTKEYTIVGIMKRPNYSVEGFTSPGYTIVTYMEDLKETANISVLYKNPKNYIDYNKQIVESINSKMENINVNQELLRYEGILGDNTLKVLYGIAAVVIVIIVVSSVFVIRNSFSISISEKNRQYGMMASVGATSKQIRKNVLFEGFIIGVIAIPLGILLGVVAIIILLGVVNYLLKDMLMGMHFVYSIKLLPILIAIIISAITIYLSCLIPAIRAAKISPIESIRGNNDIKLKSKKIKTSKLTKKLFGIGGVIASKNLKRSKKKYRTTVISIVISIFIFISLSSFITCGNKTSELYYTKLDFNTMVTGGDESTYQKISKLANVNKYSYYYESTLNIDKEKYGTEFSKENEEVEGSALSIIAYNNDYFRQYIKSLGIDEENYKTAVILIDEFVVYKKDGTKSIEKLYNIHNGEEVSIKKDNEESNIKISLNTDQRPMGLEGSYYTGGMIVVSQDFAAERLKVNLSEDFKLGSMFINSSNGTELENTLNDLSKENKDYSDISVLNYETLAAQENRMVLVISIFLYGFITVITLIGVTNIFNTITTNMILRSKEFAMLKSVGMTTKEFNKMIRLESILYGLKSLIIGIPLGIIGSYFIYKSFAQSIDVGYTLPITAIIIAIVFVFVIIALTMKYSLNKINKQNIIETIRKDNI